jgi:hypothetical protein
MYLNATTGEAVKLKVEEDEMAQESGSEQKWKQLAELATSQAKFELAHYGGLLLLATAASNAEMVRKLGSSVRHGGRARRQAEEHEWVSCCSSWPAAPGTRSPPSGPPPCWW